MAKLVRMFVALEMPPEVVSVIARVQDVLRRADEGFPLRFPQPEALHLTLKFLGEHAEGDVPAIMASLIKVKVAPVTAELAQLGAFNRRRPRVIWMGLKGTELHGLQQAVDTALAPRFERESQFVPHVTVARIKKTNADLRRLFDLMEAQLVPALSFTATEFLLKRSTLTSEGPLYETMQLYPLTGS